LVLLKNKSDGILPLNKHFPFRMKTLTEIQKDLREILPQGIDLTFQALKNLLSEGTDKYKDLILLESRYMETSRQMLQGILSNEAAQIEFNKIRKDILDFIDCLQESHLKGASAESGDGRPDIYNGEVMYRIPKKMTQSEEVKCIVRLAFDRKVIMENLEAEEGDVLKDLRISDVMGVELIDAGDNAFKIRTINDTVQFVEKDLYTEWLFYVTALLPGTHPLMLKISVIEIHDGVERKRNVVLEEKVEILTTKPVGEEPMEFASAGYSIQLASGQGAVEMPGGIKGVEPAVPSPSAPQPSAPAPPAPRAGNFKRMASALAGLLVLLVASWAIWSSLNPRNDVVTINPADKIEDGWKDAKNKNTRDAYEEFVMNNPDSEHASEARAKLDSIETATWNTALASNDVAAIQAYIDAYPNGRYREDAVAAIEQIENSVVTPDDTEPTKQDPSPAKPGKITNKKPDKKPGTGSKPNTNTNPNAHPPSTSDPTPEPKPVDPDKEIIDMPSAYRLPVHQGCENKDKKKEEECTEGKIHKHIKRFLEYPAEAKKQRIEGTITVEFVVERDGKITDVHALKDIGGGCAEEAVRIVKKLVPFKPGLNRQGQPARIRYRIPIQFKLNQ
jgi:TonB family protein